MRRPTPVAISGSTDDRRIVWRRADGWTLSWRASISAVGASLPRVSSWDTTKRGASASSIFRTEDNGAFESPPEPMLDSAVCRCGCQGISTSNGSLRSRSIHAPRTSYSRRDAEFIVEALYSAILDRGPDQQSQRSAVAEVERGNLENLLNSMLRSQEFAASRGAVSAADLLDRFYRGIFSRDADSGGVGEYLGLVRSGAIRRHAAAYDSVDRIRTPAARVAEPPQRLAQERTGVGFGDQGVVA